MNGKRETARSKESAGPIEIFRDYGLGGRRAGNAGPAEGTEVDRYSFDLRKAGYRNRSLNCCGGGWSGRGRVADVARLAMRLFSRTCMPVGGGISNERNHGENERHGEQAMEC